MMVCEDERLRMNGQPSAHDVEGMCRIVGQLIDSVESDTYIVAPSEKAELRSVCIEVVELVAPLVISQGKEICLDAAPEPVWVKGNPDLMYRAVRNLVENAIHHTPRGTLVELVGRSDGSIRGFDKGHGTGETDGELLFTCHI